MCFINLLELHYRSIITYQYPGSRFYSIYHLHISLMSDHRTSVYFEPCLEFYPKPTDTILYSYDGLNVLGVYQPDKNVGCCTQCVVCVHSVLCCVHSVLHTCVPCCVSGVRVCQRRWQESQWWSCVLYRYCPLTQPPLSPSSTFHSPPHTTSSPMSPPHTQPPPISLHSTRHP